MDFNIYINQLEKEMINTFKKENSDSTFIGFRLVDVLQNGLINKYAITYEKKVEIKINNIIHNFKVKIVDFNYFIRFNENDFIIYYSNKELIKIDNDYIKNNNNHLNEFTLKKIQRYINDINFDDNEIKSKIKQKNINILEIDSKANLKLYKEYIDFYKLASDYQLLINNIETFLGYEAIVTNNELINIFENKEGIIGDLHITMGIKNIPATLIFNEETLNVNTNIAIKFISQVKKMENEDFLRIVTEEINEDKIEGILTQNLNKNIELHDNAQIKKMFNIDLFVEQEELVYSLN